MIYIKPKRCIHAHKLTADEAGQRLAEKRKQLAKLREGPGVSGVALQHRTARGHVKRGRIHWVHLSCLSRASSPIRSVEDELKRLYTKVTQQRLTDRCSDTAPVFREVKSLFFERSLVALKKA